MDRKKGKSGIRGTIILVLLVVMLVSDAMSIHSWMENERTREEYERLTGLVRGAIVQSSTEVVTGPREPGIEPYISPISFKELMRGDPDTIGWIRVPDTNTDHPVVQGENNDFYLNHDFYSKENITGAIYLDFESQGDFVGWNNVLYGHNMKNGSMLKDVDRYRDEAYSKEHQFLSIYTPDRKIRLKAVAVYYGGAQPVIHKIRFKSQESFDALVHRVMKPCGYGDEIAYPAKTPYILTMCSYEINGTKAYLFVVEVDEDGNQIQPDDVFLQYMDELTGDKTKDKTQETAQESLQGTAGSAREGGQQEMIIYDSCEFPVKGSTAVFTIIYILFPYKKAYLGIEEQSELCYTQHVRCIYAQKSKARRV